MGILEGRGLSVRTCSGVCLYVCVCVCACVGGENVMFVVREMEGVPTSAGCPCKSHGMLTCTGEKQFSRRGLEVLWDSLVVMVICV